MKLSVVASVTSIIALGSALAAAQEVDASASGQASASTSGMGLPGQAGDGSSDHAGVVGHMGIGFLGRRTMSIANGAGTPTPVTAPVVGVRYWMNNSMGLDVGLGLTATTGSIEVDGNSNDKVGVTAMIVHAGVPLALASSGHFTFQVVPEMNLGLATATDEGPDPNNDLFGYHFDIGARAGAEVHFGFIDIPQLSLQGGIGVALVHDYVSASNVGADVEVSDNTVTLGTSLNGDPWNIFSGSISALYYF